MLTGVSRSSQLLTGSADDPESEIDQQRHEEWLLAECRGCHAIVLAQREYDIEGVPADFEGQPPFRTEVVFDEHGRVTLLSEPEFDPRSIAAVARHLERTSHALNYWTWEDQPRVSTGQARRWHIDHEYHVQIPCAEPAVGAAGPGLSATEQRSADRQHRA